MKAIPPLPVLSLPVGTLRVLHCRGCMPGCMPQSQSQGPRGARAVLPSHSCMNSPVVSVRSLAVFGHVAQVGGFAWVYIGLIWHLLRRWILHACLACAAGGCVCCVPGNACAPLSSVCNSLSATDVGAPPHGPGIMPPSSRIPPAPVHVPKWIIQHDRCRFMARWRNPPALQCQ